MKNILQTLTSANNYMKSKNITGQITYRGESSKLVRAANNQISLSVSENGSKCFITIQKGKKIANSSVVAGDTDSNFLTGVIDKLHAEIDFMPDIPFLTPMESIAEDIIDEATFDSSIENIQQSIPLNFFKEAVDRYEKQSASISGAFSSGMYEFGTINTFIDKPSYYKGTDFNLELVLQLADENKELRCADVGSSISHYNPSNIFQHMDKILDLKKHTSRIDVPKGKYNIIFGADAISELITFLFYLGLMGETYEYKMGMLQRDQHNIGDKIFGENITISDNPLSNDILFPHRFGINGVIRKPVSFVENGILKNICYSDKIDADRFNQKVNNSWESVNIKVHPGDGPDSFDNMVKSVSGKAIYIPYLHYMNVPNATKGEITASSRFGTFLIENGRITNHLYNVRILDSLFNIFSNVVWLSSKLKSSNISDTYGLRFAQAVKTPAYMLVENVPIIATSAVSG